MHLYTDYDPEVSLLITPHIPTTPLSQTASSYSTSSHVRPFFVEGRPQSPDDHKSTLPQHLSRTHRSRSPRKNKKICSVWEKINADSYQPP